MKASSPPYTSICSNVFKNTEKKGKETDGKQCEKYIGKDEGILVCW